MLQGIGRDEVSNLIDVLRGKPRWATTEEQQRAADKIERLRAALLHELTCAVGRGLSEADAAKEIAALNPVGDRQDSL